MLIGGRVMTTGSVEEKMVAGPCSTLPKTSETPKLGWKYFDEELCYASPTGNTKRRIELCKTLLPVQDCPMSPPPHERGPSEKVPLPPQVSVKFRVSHHIRNTASYDDWSTKRYTSCMVCGRSVHAIKRES